MADVALQEQQNHIPLPVFSTDAPRAFAGLDAFTEQAYLNCFPIIEKNLASPYAQPSVSVIKRAGSTAISTMLTTESGAAGIGSYGTRDDMLCLENKCISQLYDVYVAAFFDSNNSKIYIIQYRPISLTTTKIGELSGCTANDLVFITEITQGDTLLPAIAVSYQTASRSSGTGYYANSTGGVFTASSLVTISSSSFPANLGTPKIITGPFQYMNGHSYITTLDGFIYMSSLTAAGNPDISAWNTLATVVASQSPDKGMGVFRYKNFLVAFGQSSLEFFVDAGNPPPGSTLERTDQAYIKFGCFTPKAVTTIDDTLYWVGYSDSNTIGVFRMEGFAPTKISTQKQDAFINQFFVGNTQTIGFFSLETLMLNNKKHLLINGPKYLTYPSVQNGPSATSGSSSDTYIPHEASEAQGRILAYNINDGVWWGLQVADPVTSMGIPANNYTYVRSTGVFPATSQAGAYQQFCFFSRSTATGQDQASSTCPRKFVINTGGNASYSDANPHGEQTSIPITMVLQLNTYWFTTERRKRINRVTLLTDGLQYTDSNVYALYISWMIDNEISTGNTPNTRCRRIVIPTGLQRYYINNLGMARSIMFSVYCKSVDSFTVRGIELNLAQGTA